VFIRFKKKTALPVCAYDDAHRRWGAGVDEEFEAGDETEVSLLRENEDTLDIEIPGSGIVFDLPKADVDVLPLDAVEGSHILQGILPWPWEAEPTKTRRRSPALAGTRLRQGSGAAASPVDPRWTRGLLAKADGTSCSARMPGSLRPRRD